MLVRFQKVSGNAAAEIRAFGVHASLRTQPGRFAFVQVFAVQTVAGQCLAFWTQT